MLHPALCLLLATCAAAADWMVGWTAAADAAAKDKKVIIADFTGSDWCGWCIKLKDEVFKTPEFAAWAKDKAVLLTVDFPRQNNLPAAQQQENKALLDRYKVEGFPTILLLRPDGSEIGRLGYMRGGPAAWTAAADKLLATK